MKKLTKFFSIIMVLVLSLSFAACGKKNEEKEVVTDKEEQGVAGEDTEKEVTEEPVEPESTDPRDKLEAFDLGGRTITISSWYESMKSSDTPEPDSTALPEDIAKYENIKRIEEKYNCKIKMVVVPWGELSPQLTTSVMAGTPYADIVHLPMDYAVPAIVNDLLLPLSEVTSPSSDVITDKIAVKSIGKVIDDEYLVRAVGLGVNGTFMGYNKDMIEALGLQDPQELYRNNPDEWTWDKFLEYAKAATKDTDGNGNIDQGGYAGFINVTLANFVVANGGAIYNDFTSKQGLDDPKTVEALEFINKLYNEDKVALNVGGDIWNYDGNLNAWTEGYVLFFPIQAWQLAEADSLPFEYSILPFPKGPSNDTGKTYTSNFDGFAIPKGVEDPQKVYQVLEELMWFFGDDTSIRDDSTTEWLQTLYLTQEDVDLSIEISDNNGQTELYSYVPNFPMGDVIGNIINGTMTVAQAIEANKQIAQDAIDTMLGSKSE